MKILYVFAHPNPTSFNRMLKQHAVDLFTQLKTDVQFSNLYEDNFKAVADWDDFECGEREFSPPQYLLAQQEAYQKEKLSADIRAELTKITWSDHILFQFPLWWFSTPAILKGWLDRVLVKGFAYDTGKVFNEGLLKGKTASLVLTTQSPESAYQLDGLHQARIETFLHPIHHTLHFVGIKTLAPFVIYSAFNLETATSELLVKDYLDYLIKLSHTGDAARLA